MLYDDGVMVDMEARNIHGLYFPSSSLFPKGMGAPGSGILKRILELLECRKVPMCIETYLSFLKSPIPRVHLSYVRSENGTVMCNQIITSSTSKVNHHLSGSQVTVLL